MASLVSKLSFFFFFVLLVLSPQIQAREGKVFSLFTHFRTIYNVKEHQNLPVKPKAKSPISAPTPAPALEPVAAPTPEPITAPEPAPESGPAPEPEFVDNGNGYGLYGTKSSTTQHSSPNKETPMATTTTFENELLDEDLTAESYNSNSKYNYNPSSFSNNEVYRNSNSYNNEEEFSSSSNNGYNNMNHEDSYSNNYNNEEEFRSSSNNGYNKNHEDSYSNNNYNERYTNNYNNGNEYKNNNYNERYTNNYNTGNEYNSNNVYDEVKREGMSDTRFLENGKYYYPVKNNNNQNYNLNEYESVRGNTENEGYYEKTQYPNEFDTMEEYEKQQESQGYTP